jgi:hypothetical protein
MEPNILFWFNCFKEELQWSFLSLSRVDLLKEYLQCTQEQNMSIHNFYHQLLMLQKRASLKDDNLLVSHFHKGLHANLHWGVEMLPNSTTIAKLKEHTSKYKSQLQVMKPVCVVVALPPAEEQSAIQEVHEEMQDLHDDLHNVVAWVWSGPAHHPTRPMAKVQCYSCHRWGHFTHNCPKGSEAQGGPGSSSTTITSGAGPVATVGHVNTLVSN